MSEVRPSSSPPAAGGGSGTPASLADAVSQTGEVKEKIESVGDGLLVVGTVLKQEIPKTLQTGEVAQALEKHEELETTVKECVDDLAEVSEALEEEVERRKRLERELAESQAALVSGKSANA